MKTLCTAFLCAHAVFAWANTPIFTLTPQGTLPTTVSSTGTATATYIVTNNTPYPLQNIGLVYPPAGQTPFGVTQNTTVVSTPTTCANTFTLVSGGSCTLVLTISGSNLENGQAVGGPEICYSKNNPARCSVPTPANQLNVALGAAPLLSLAVGQDHTGSRPAFLVQSTDAGSTWSLGTMPDDLPVTSAFSSASSISGLSIAVGSDQVANEPLIVQSTDMGTSWSIANIPTLMKNNKSSYLLPFPQLSGSTCTSTDCIAVGISDTSAPVLYQLFISQNTWTIPTISGLTSQGELFAVNCSSDVCIAAGLDDNLNAPLVVQSATGSGSWTVGDLSSVTSSGNFFGGACTGNYCLAVGADASSSDQPLLAYTNNAGATWQQFDLYGSGTLSGGYQGEFDAASCSSTICVASGYNDSYGSPLLVQSIDGGSSWTLIDLSTLTPPVLGGELYANSCSASLCVAVGNDGSNAPVIVEYSGSGTTWTSIDLSIISSGQLSAVYCDGSYCVTAGRSSGAPILLQRSDLGVWSIVTVAGTPTTGVYNGTFASSLKRSIRKFLGLFSWDHHA